MTSVIEKGGITVWVSDPQQIKRLDQGPLRVNAAVFWDTLAVKTLLAMRLWARLSSEHMANCPSHELEFGSEEQRVYLSVQLGAVKADLYLVPDVSSVQLVNCIKQCHRDSVGAFKDLPYMW